MSEGRPTERGAAAVEFALVLPLLIALVFGISDFGRAYMMQSSLSMAAREGARVMAITGDGGEAVLRAQQAAADLGVFGATANVGACSGSPESTTVTVSADFDFFLPLPDTTISGRGVMRCGG